MPRPLRFPESRPPPRRPSESDLIANFAVAKVPPLRRSRRDHVFDSSPLGSKSWALSDSHDLMTQNGNWAMVSGVDALPQQVRTSLSHQRGESPLHRDFGTRFAEYYKLLSGSPWFDRYLKLEVIRQAAIPYANPTNNQQYTPLLCVEQVFGVEVLADAPTNKWLPIRVDLSVKGVGRWQHDLSVCIPPEPMRWPSFDDLLAGPSQGIPRQFCPPGRIVLPSSGSSPFSR